MPSNPIFKLLNVAMVHVVYMMILTIISSAVLIKIFNTPWMLLVGMIISAIPIFILLIRYVNKMFTEQGSQDAQKEK
jgi:hypothetical protein